jgi:hypothetical protein
MVDYDIFKLVKIHAKDFKKKPECKGYFLNVNDAMNEIMRDIQLNAIGDKEHECSLDFVIDEIGQARAALREISSCLDASLTEADRERLEENE